MSTCSRSDLLVHVLVVGDVLNDLGGGEELLGMVVGDLEAELVLHGHDDLHVVEGIEAEVLDEVGLKGELERTRSRRLKEGKMTFADERHRAKRPLPSRG